MSIRDQIRQKSAALVRSECVALPDMGVEIEVRGMMLGERNRVMGEGYDKDGRPVPSKLYPLLVALTCYDPSSGKQVWNPNVLEDRQEIEAMPGPTVDEIVAVALRLSGMDKDAPKEPAPGSAVSAG